MFYAYIKDFLLLVNILSMTLNLNYFIKHKAKELIMEGIQVLTL